ncbi:MAG: FtsX-like permease family protein [Bacteroidota bacterium]
MLNEHAVRQMGFESPEAAVNQTLKYGDEKAPTKIIGVVKDFVAHSLTRGSKPLMLAYEPDAVKYLNLRIQPQTDIGATLTFVEKQWAAMDPVHPVSYRFYEDKLFENIAPFQDASKLLGFLSFTILLISCMGLLGISSYTAQTMRKEVGIRKVLGADVLNIVWTISKGMVLSIIVAVLLGMPVVYFLNSAWLQTLAYRIDLNFMNIGLGVLLILLLGVGIVASQAWRTAVDNPINALRSE